MALIVLASLLQFANCINMSRPRTYNSSIGKEFNGFNHSEKIIQNLKYLEPNLKVLSRAEQNLFLDEDVKRFTGNNFSVFRNQEIERSFGASIFTSIPIEIVSESKFMNAFRNIGREGEFFSLANKLLIKKECLQIVVIGGSVTAMCMNGTFENMIASQNLTWPRKLEYLLNERYPNCSSPIGKIQSAHEVHNLAVGGANSEYFCRSMMSWRKDTSHVIHFSDLVMIDEVRNDDFSNAQYYEELLALLIKNSSALENPPALLWLGLGGWGSVLRLQVAMAKIHGFPMFHIPDMFLKNSLHLTAEMEEHMNPYDLGNLENEHLFHQFFTKRLYKSDPFGHLRGFPHSIIATYVFSVIEHLACHSNDLKSNLKHPLPRYVSEKVITMFLEADPYVVATNNRHSDNHYKVMNGFKLASDQPHRMVGMLSYSVGDNVTIVLPTTPNLKFGFFTITFLRSYVQMGTMEIAIAPLMENASMRNISYHNIDCQWSKNISIPVTEEIAVDKTKFLNFPMEIIITVVESSPPRQSNKIKIVDIGVY